MASTVPTAALRRLPDLKASHTPIVGPSLWASSRSLEAGDILKRFDQLCYSVPEELPVKEATHVCH
jgi:hypothetical protein